jgi:hypothetical protein
VGEGGGEGEKERLLSEVQNFINILFGHSDFAEP